MLVRALLLHQILRGTWGRIAAYTIFGALCYGGVVATTTAQAEARDAGTKLSTAQTALRQTTSVSAALHDLRQAISEAKQRNLDTSDAEATLDQATLLARNGQYEVSYNLAETTAGGLSTAASDADAAAAAAAAEDAKYGTVLVLTSTGADTVGHAMLNGAEAANATSDASGNVSLRLLVGTYSVVIEKSGFISQTLDGVVVTSKSTTTLTVTLVAVPSPSATPRPTPRPTAKPTATPPPATSSCVPNSCYRRQTITTDRGSFVTDIATFDLGPGKIKVITDTASDSDCATNCPVMDIKSYVNRYQGVVAAVNGTYFCPADYSSCYPNEVNNFFWKIQNPRVGTMINAHDGLGEFDPFLTFAADGTATYYSSWASAPTVYAGINHKPAVVTNGVYSVDESKLDTKQLTAKISRAALGLKGQTLTLAIVQSATIMDLGSVMAAMGVTVALNIDAGGSSALWYNGSYKRGPGRGVPNALVFVQQ